MLHLVSQSRSSRTGKRFTAPGLGDRIHLATLAYAYSQEMREEVTLHVTSEQCSNGPANYGSQMGFPQPKSESWAQILNLMEGVTIKVHPVRGLSQMAWRLYVQRRGYPCKSYHYTAEDTKDSVGIVRHLCAGHRVPRWTPHSGAVAHFDAGLDDRCTRRVSQETKTRALAAAAKEAGEVTVVGREALVPALAEDFPAIVKTVKAADLFVGVDSAFAHLALLYLPPDRVWIYTDKKRLDPMVELWSKMGCRVNP